MQLDEGVDWNQPAKFAVCSNQWLDSTRDYIRYVLNFIRRYVPKKSEDVFLQFFLYVFFSTWDLFPGLDLGNLIPPIRLGQRYPDPHPKSAG